MSLRASLQTGVAISRYKEKYYAQYYRDHPHFPIQLHVCWKSENGFNCCSCENCYRTMVGLWIAGQDPKKFGFNYDVNVLERIYQQIALREPYSDVFLDWHHMQGVLKQNKYHLEQKPYYKKLEWLLHFDFLHPEKNTCRQKYRATWKYKSKIVKAFPRLYKLYVKLRGYRFE